MRVVRFVPSSTPVIDATRRILVDEKKWVTANDDTETVDAVVYDPGLLDEDGAGDSSQQLASIASTTTFRSKVDGGGSIVVVGSRDQLGRAGQTAAAARAAALFAAVRSLALECAPAGVSVNLVAGPSSGINAPDPLLPHAANPEDIAESVSFFADPATRYITGQLLFCDAGTSLLSSMSI